MKRSFISYYLKAFYCPGTMFDQLLSDDRRFRFGFYFMLIPSALYTLMYIMLVIGDGAPSVFTPWLNIPKEEYYAWNRFLVAPSMFVSWILAAGVVQILSHTVIGKGTFDNTLSVLGLSVAVAMWATLLHDLAMSFLSAIQVINAHEHEIAMNSPTIWRTILWICMIGYVVWFLLLFTKAIGKAHKISTIRAFLLGLAGFITFQSIFLLFNR